MPLDTSENHCPYTVVYPYQKRISFENNSTLLIYPMSHITIRQQKRNQREADIISATMELLKDRSFLELRMSEVAKKTECSMGAIYSHFSSKEDLLIGCTAQIVKTRCEKSRDLLQGIDDPLDQIIINCFIFWIEDNLYPQHYELCHLAWNPSVWQRASEQRNDELNKAGNEKGDILLSCGKRVLEEHLELPATDDLIDELLMSLCGLSVGIYHFKESSLGVSEVFVNSHRSTELHIDCLARVLTGWGIKRNDLTDYLWDLYNYTASQLTPEN